MPRVWHQPSLGRENIWMFHHLEHGECLGTMFLLLPVLLWRHRVGGSKPNMVTLLFPAWSDLQSLVIPCFFSFYYSSDSSFFLKEELTLLSRAPDSSGSDSSAISSLCVFNGYQNISWYFFCFLFLSCWHLHQDLFRFEVCKVCN